MSAMAVGLSSARAEKLEFVEAVHLLRAVAIIGVVLAHSLPAFDWSQSPETRAFLYALSIQSSILFFFVSGFLFQYLSPRFKYGPFLLHKVKTVAAPYVLVSIPAIALSVGYGLQNGEMWLWFKDLPAWQQVGLFLVTGKHFSPFWFIPTLLLIFVLAPLWLLIDRKAPWIYLLIPVWLAWSVTHGRNGPYGPISMLFYILPVFLIGMVVSRFWTDIIQVLTRRLWLVGVCAALSFAGLLLLAGSGLKTDLQIPFKIAMALLILALFTRFDVRANPLMGEIAHSSYAIYLIHCYLVAGQIALTSYLFTGSLSLAGAGGLLPGNFINWLAYAAVLLVVSLIAVRIAKRMFGKHSRMIIGA
jgi:hypothetical protein